MMKTVLYKPLKAAVANPLKPKSLFLKNGLIYQDGTFKKANVILKDRKIASITNHGVDNVEQFDIIDLKGNYLTPSLVDQHIHGGLGFDFNEANESQMRAMLRKMKQFGCGAILATFIPATAEVLNRQIDIIKNIMKKPNCDETTIAGIHLEGPFINPQKAGIHPPHTLMLPTLENLNKINLNDVKMVTIAPELDEDYKVIEFLNLKGIITSAGHSTASADMIEDSGVRQITHLFNAMIGYHHRIPSIVNEGLENDDITVELNTIKELIDYRTMDTVAKLKPKDKLIFISDALAGASCPNKSFDMNGKTIYIGDDGSLKDKDGILAGSGKYLGQVARSIVKNTKITFADFIRFASENPAVNIGIENDYKIAKGKSPSLTIWDKNTLEPKITFNA